MRVSAASLPVYEKSDTVVRAPGDGPGNWAGAPSAVWAGGAYWLAYRLRRPLDAGRGVTIVVARSTDGLAFEPLSGCPGRPSAPSRWSVPLWSGYRGVAGGST